jgi:hypothetical protein
MFPVDARQVEILHVVVVEALRRKTPAERIAMALEANRVARLRIEGHLRTIHPDWTGQQIDAEIARRMCLGAG